MKRIKKVVAVTGKYTDKNGQEKNQYVTCGAMFKREDGSVCMKLDSLPLGDFNGWLNFYDLEEDRPANNAKGMAQAKGAMAPAPEIVDDDIPF